MLCLGGARHAEHMKRARVKSYAPNQGSSALWKRISEHDSCKLSSNVKLHIQPEGSMVKENSLEHSLTISNDTGFWYHYMHTCMHAQSAGLGLESLYKYYKLERLKQLMTSIWVFYAHLQSFFFFLESTVNQVKNNVGTPWVYAIRHSALLMTAAGSQSKSTFG